MAKKGFRFKGGDEAMHIRFDEDHKLHGLEISVRRRVPVGVVMAISRADVGRTAEIFAQQVLTWNVLGPDDEPVPVSVEAFGEHVGIEDLTAIITAWTEALTEPGAPLSGQSSAGGR